ncbi:MAG: hydrogen peroxide-inducible genes activator [Pelagimonas sp.]|uniref:hydrogen peroxide-inducible genes activator n=1 Tax=Pelagimonas sp. TaxID=2073170 RepID=UPI003D6A73FE
MTTLRQMRFLVALSDTENFSRAAELCNVSQSTLSTGLKEMEVRLGVKVAERSTHSVMMTSIGTTLAERAREILAKVTDFEATAQAETSAGMTQLRLGVIPTVGPFLLPRALPGLRETWPTMQIYLREELTESLLSGLTEGRLDLILIALPHDLPTQVETMLLFEDNYSLATPRAHPLANLSRVEGTDLAGRRLLLLERGHCLQKHALSSVPGIALEEDTSFSATSLPTLVSMVEEGIGVTLLPNLAINAGLTAGHDLHLSHLEGANPRRIVLAWRDSSAQSDVFRKIGENLRRSKDSAQ